MKISEYRQMMAYLTREARNPTPRVDMKLRETGAEISKGYADGRLVRPKNLKDKFPKVMFDKSKNKFTAMEPKDDKLVDQIYNSPDPTAAVKKLVKDEISKISKEITAMEQRNKLLQEMNNIPKPKMERAKESGLSAEFTKEKLDEAKILKDL